MSSQPKVGDRRWCVAASIESEPHDCGPVEPWYGQVTRTWTLGVTPMVSISTVGGGAELRPDEDSNATSIVAAAKTYATEADAWDAYVAGLYATLDSLTAELAACEEEVDRAKETARLKRLVEVIGMPPPDASGDYHLADGSAVLLSPETGKYRARLPDGTVASFVAIDTGREVPIEFDLPEKAAVCLNIRRATKEPT